MTSTSWLAGHFSRFCNIGRQCPFHDPRASGSPSGVLYFVFKRCGEDEAERKSLVLDLVLVMRLLLFFFFETLALVSLFGVL